MNNPNVFVFITNWNGRKHLEKLLPSLVNTQYDNFSINVLDNCSTDDSEEFVRKNYPKVNFIRNKKNLGYVGNCNKGFSLGLKSKAKYIVLLSNDVIMDERWLKEAVNALESDKSIGIAGFDIIDDPLPSDYGKFIREKKRRKMFSVAKVKYLTGCGLVLPSRIVKAIGFFDPAYVMYGEENDYEARVQRAGYILASIDVPMYHASEGTSWGKMKIRTSMYSIRNTMRYAIKNEGFFRALLIICFVFYMGCWPFKRINPKDPTQRRLRPRIFFVNFFIDLYALFWNIFHIYGTLKRRISDNSKADLLKSRK